MSFCGSCGVRWDKSQKKGNQGGQTKPKKSPQEAASAHFEVPSVGASLSLSASSVSQPVQPPRVEQQSRTLKAQLHHRANRIGKVEARIQRLENAITDVQQRWPRHVHQVQQELITDHQRCIDFNATATKEIEALRQELHDSAAGSAVPASGYAQGKPTNASHAFSLRFKCTCKHRTDAYAAADVFPVACTISGHGNRSDTPTVPAATASDPSSCTDGVQCAKHVVTSFRRTPPRCSHANAERPRSPDGYGFTPSSNDLQSGIPKWISIAIRSRQQSCTCTGSEPAVTSRHDAATWKLGLATTTTSASSVHEQKCSFRCTFVRPAQHRGTTATRTALPTTERTPRYAVSSSGTKQPATTCIPTTVPAISSATARAGTHTCTVLPFQSLSPVTEAETQNGIGCLASMSQYEEDHNKLQQQLAAAHAAYTQSGANQTGQYVDGLSTPVPRQSEVQTVWSSPENVQQGQAQFTPEHFSLASPPGQRQPKIAKSVPGNIHNQQHVNMPNSSEEVPVPDSEDPTPVPTEIPTDSENQDAIDPQNQVLSQLE